MTKPTTNPVVPAGNSPRLSGFYLAPLYTWSIDYFPANFNSTGDGGNAGNIWKQLYFRQAFQYLVDQPAVIAQDRQGLRGAHLRARARCCRPTPSSRASRRATPTPTACPRPRALLTSHGWKVVAERDHHVHDPGTGADQCGTDIPAGAQLAFNLEYREREPVASRASCRCEKSSWAQVGINVTLSQAPFDTVIGNATACTPGPNCTWELENWGRAGCTPPTTTPPVRRPVDDRRRSNSGSYSDADQRSRSSSRPTPPTCP